MFFWFFRQRIGYFFRGATAVLWLVCCFPENSVAQENASSRNSADSLSITRKTHHIGAVKVRGERRRALEGSTVSVVDSASLAESAGNTMAELLARHTPIFVKTTGMGGAATVSFRGTGPSHTQVEWNGVNINNPMGGQVDFSLIPTGFTDMAELYHGGSSLRLGSGGLGGAIVIGSRPRWDKPLYGSLSQGFGSYGLYQGFATAGGGSSRIQVRVRYIYDEARNDFGYYNTAVVPHREMTQSNAAYEKQGAAADVFWRPRTDQLVALSFWGQTCGRDLPRTMTYEGRDVYEHQDDDQIRLAASWNRFGRRMTTKIVSGFTWTNLDYVFQLVRGEAMRSNIFSRNVARTFQNRAHFDCALSPRWSIRASVNADWQNALIIPNTNDRRNNPANKPDRFEAGAAVTVAWEASERFSAFALLREEVSAGNFSPVMPAVGARYGILKNKALDVRINAARNYHYPTLNDLYWVPGGNPDLKPERSLTADLGLATHIARGGFSFDASLTGYVSRIDDWILWTVGGFHYQTSAQNIRRVRIRGLEAFASAGYSADGLTLDLSANYSYTKSSNETGMDELDQTIGKQLVYIPVHKANVTLEGSWRGWYVWWIWSVVGERFTNAANASRFGPLDPYDLHNALAGKRIDIWKTGLDLRLRINNVFDRRYQAILWRAQPGRNYSFTATVSF